MSQLSSYELRKDVALIGLDDGKANALSHDMLDQLASALDRAEAEAGAVVIAGREGRFCAGFDLATMMQGVDAAKALFERGADIYLRLYAFPLPVVAACTGHALAGGALLLLVSDTRVGAEGAFKIGLNEVAISMPLPLLARELARDRLCPRHLTEAAIQARIYTPEAASEAGFLDQLARPEETVASAIAEASRLAELPRAPYATTKAALRHDTITRIRDGLATDFATITAG